MSINFQSGYIAIIGQPNAGKSTLMNQLLNVKLSITSPRPQTTRRRVMGILNQDKIQIIFLDTPGILKPNYNLQREMMRHVDLAIQDADTILYMVDSTLKLDRILEDIDKLKTINPGHKPIILTLNKIDLVSKSFLLPIMKQLNESYKFEEIIPISAKKQEGLDQLIESFKKYIPLHPPFYEPEILTDQPERFFVAEFVRQQAFYQYQKEIPYAMEAVVREFKERKNKKNYVLVDLFVERDTQKAIVIGKKGEALKNLNINARKEVQKFLDTEIYLEIKVKLKKNWRKNTELLKQMGY